MERYVKAAPADDLTGLFFDGEVKRQRGHCADALPRYDQVIAKVAGARRFPEDDRAKEAKAAIKRLAGS